MRDAKWDAEAHKGYKGYAPPPWGENSTPPGDGEELALVPVAVSTVHGTCSFCKLQVPAGASIWVRYPKGYICVPCANRLRGAASRGSSHRCIECSLVRCSAPDSRCEECAANMAA